MSHADAWLTVGWDVFRHIKYLLVPALWTTFGLILNHEVNDYHKDFWNFIGFIIMVFAVIVTAVSM